ncbi:nucleosome assembly protein 1-like 1 [Fistulifera solaris]|uniref:Nucleosome assembly protein 1-like 1 n=1 Tax=Fistulifera solaris TaxID=1519565 RepID=A0A1Z5JZ40_FISSO|nr:nucleosome assembly protein 1-like 1 [Fistulifera solaris]|eukprot:GAX19267.1 nucleosome assembly protein 1-like 1 [Fistulifera solaris]
MTNGSSEQHDLVPPDYALGDDTDDEDQESDDEVDPLSHLPTYVVRRVEKLQDLDANRESIMEDYLKERAALERKYSTLIKPLYEKRAEVIRGEHDESIANATPAEIRDSQSDEENVTGIPQFWACAMTHMETIGELITEEDVDCLEHLQDIQCEDDVDGKGFTLRFFFAENEYFTNTVLTKSYQVPNLLVSDEPMIKNVEGTKIDWKPDKCLTHKKITKKQRGKGRHAGQVRTIVQQEEKESFFNWFSAPELPSLNPGVDEMDEEEIERLEELFESDYDVAQAFRSNVIPKAVGWFTGKAMQEEMEGVLGGGQNAADEGN